MGREVNVEVEHMKSKPRDPICVSCRNPKSEHEAAWRNGVNYYPAFLRPHRCGGCFDEKPARRRRR